MIFDVELHYNKWNNCENKWCNYDGGYWCMEDCKPKPPDAVAKILSTGDAVYILYANGSWRKKER